MSGHETIRVLEVGVDGDPKTAGEGAGGSPAQGGPPGVEDAPSSTPSSSGGEAAGERPPSPKNPPGTLPPVPPGSIFAGIPPLPPGSLLPGIPPVPPGSLLPGTIPGAPRICLCQDPSQSFPQVSPPRDHPQVTPGSTGGVRLVSPGLCHLACVTWAAPGPAAVPPPPLHLPLFWADLTLFCPAPKSSRRCVPNHLHTHTCHLSPVPASLVPGGRWVVTGPTLTKSLHPLAGH